MCLAQLEKPGCQTRPAWSWAPHGASGVAEGRQLEPLPKAEMAPRVQFALHLAVDVVRASFA